MAQAIFLAYKIRLFSWVCDNCGFKLQKTVTTRTTTITQCVGAILLPSVTHPPHWEDTGMSIAVVLEHRRKPLPFFYPLASV